MVDESTRKTLSSIPLLQIKAGPRDKDIWVARLKEEYQALIKVIFTSEYVMNYDSSGLECTKQGAMKMRLENVYYF